MDMKYTVYKIVNKVNGKIYIGCHKTTDLEDGYMGSGIVLKRAIKKYGIENFEKEILEAFDNPEDMFEMEAKLVDHDDPNSYNIKKGGLGGFDFINTKGLNVANIQRVNELGLNNSKDQYKLGNKRIKELMKDPEWKEAWRRKVIEGDPGKGFRGQKHTEETKRKIGRTNSKLMVGAKNGAFGKMWITNESESKMIPKTNKIPKGWRKGRTIAG